MDPISAVQALCTLAITLKAWLDARKDKEAVIASLSTTVTRIYDVVAPIEGVAGTLDSTIVAAFLSVFDVLSRTKEHLVAWGSKKPRPKSLTGITAFFAPDQVIASLRADERDLNNQLIMMLFTLAMKDFFRDAASQGSQNADRFHVPLVTNEELSDFWQDYIGGKIMWASTDTICHGIIQFVKTDLSDEACCRMSCYLDEFKTGGVARSSLERLVGKRRLAEFVKQFQESTPPLRQTFQNEDFRLPLLLWIDDNPNNNIAEMSFASTHGINIVVVTSTAEAKDWIDINEEFLRQNDTPSRIRVITDNARFESDPQSRSSPGPLLNTTAGETIVRYLRGRVNRIPILVFCDGSLPYTQYVTAYGLTGSTRESGVVMDYIMSLSVGDENDAGWDRFGAVKNISQTRREDEHLTWDSPLLYSGPLR